MSDQAKKWFYTKRWILGSLVLIILVVAVAVSASGGHKQKALATVPTAPQDLTASNNPTIKALTTVPSDYVGQSFDLVANVTPTNYYNYGFLDDSKWYSLQLSDSSVSVIYEEAYAYMPKNPANKVLMDRLVANSPQLVRVHVEVPKSKYQANSNAFLQIDSWSLVSDPTVSSGPVAVPVTTVTKTVAPTKPKAVPVATTMPTPAASVPAAPALPTAQKTWHTVSSELVTDETKTDEFHMQGAKWRITYLCSSSNPNNGFFGSIISTDGSVRENFASNVTCPTVNAVNEYSEPVGNYYLDLDPIGFQGMDGVSVTVEDYY